MSNRRAFFPKYGLSLTLGGPIVGVLGAVAITLYVLGRPGWVRTETLLLGGLFVVLSGLTQLVLVRKIIFGEGKLVVHRVVGRTEIAYSEIRDIGLRGLKSTRGSFTLLNLRNQEEYESTLRKLANSGEVSAHQLEGKLASTEARMPVVIAGSVFVSWAVSNGLWWLGWLAWLPAQYFWLFQISCLIVSALAIEYVYRRRSASTF